MVALFSFGRKEEILKKNIKVRKALLANGMTLKDLSEIVDMSQSALTMALSRFELSAGETNELLRKIKDAGERGE